MVLASRGPLGACCPPPGLVSSVEDRSAHEARGVHVITTAPDNAMHTALRVRMRQRRRVPTLQLSAEERQSMEASGSPCPRHSCSLAVRPVPRDAGFACMASRASLL